MGPPARNRGNGREKDKTREEGAQNSATNAWIWNRSNWNTNNKSNTNAVVPFFDIAAGCGAADFIGDHMNIWVYGNMNIRI